MCESVCVLTLSVPSLSVVTTAHTVRLVSVGGDHCSRSPSHSVGGDTGGDTGGATGDS